MKKGARRAGRDRDSWRALVADWRASGERAADFARRRGLKVASLYYWSSVLGRENEPAARLVPVHLAPSVAPTVIACELVVGRTRVRFQEGTSPSYVAALARALVEAAAG
jgi:hypothetical protein